jgi:Leucine-rich repeat (LRR) protein
MSLLATVRIVRHHVLLVCCSCLVFLISQCHCSARCTQPLLDIEYNALQDIYYNTSGDSWIYGLVPNATKWHFPANLTTPCIDLWQGLTCARDASGEFCHIAAIDLHELYLSGPLPVTVGNFVNITSFVVSDNYLSGYLPSELAKLTTLLDLGIDGNYFSGTFASELVQLQKLTTLDATLNHLSGQIAVWLADIFAVVLLYLDENAFSGPIPLALASKENLIALALNTNRLTGPVPSELGALSALTELYLSSNNLTSTIPPELGNLTGLRFLHLNANSLTSSIPSALGNLGKATELVLNGNFLTNTIPTELGLLTSLTLLELNSNELIGPIPSELANLENLVYLYAYENSLSCSLSSQFGRLQHVTTVVLNDNMLVGSIATEIATMQKLQVLQLSSNQITGSVPSALANLIRIGSLDVGDNLLSGTLPTELSSIPTLEYLSLSSNYISGEIPASYGSMVFMTYFLVDNNVLSGLVPSELGGMQRLTAMYLTFNYFSGLLPSEFLSRLYHLTTFYGSENYFVGPITPAVNNLTKLQTFNVSSNLMTGVLPAFNTALVSLDVSSNLFAGNLGDSLLLCSSMKAINLANNQFSDEIPAYFASFASLQYMNASNNNFDGSVDVFGSTVSLQFLDVSNNTLSGTLNSALFEHSALQVVVIYNNCFSGRLPAAICSGSQLEYLIMDSLTANCGDAVNPLFRPLFGGIFPKRYMQGSVPSCVWSMPNLKMLHLSGNGLSGTIGPIVANESVLDVVVLSSNLFEGSIPHSLQLYGKFSQLDLSENKLSGTLVDNFATFGRASLLDLTVNRLSGRLPSTFYNASVLNVLEGNLFQCQVQNMPSADPSSSEYVCGSDDFNISLIVAGTCFGLVALLIAIALPNWIDTAVYDVQCLSPLRKVTWLIGQAVSVIIVVTVVLYVSMKEAPLLSQYFSTHAEQYTWTATSAFLHGWLPAFVVMAVLAVCTQILLQGVYDSSSRGSRLTDIRQCNGITTDAGCHYLRCAGMHIVNITAVIIINALYVLALVSGMSQGRLFAIQLLLSIYKLIWSSVTIPWILHLCIGNHPSRLSHRVFMTLFSFVGAPFISEFFSSSNCFLYTIVNQEPVMSAMVLPAYTCGDLCHIRCPASYCFVDCSFVCQFDPFDMREITVSAVPPWMYSYQCSSSLLTDYVPVLLLSFVLSGVVAPVIWLIPKYFPEQVETLRRTVTARRSHDPDPRDSVNANTILDGHRIRVKLVLNMTVLLTFGIASPLLAVVVLCETASSCISWHMLVGMHIRLLGEQGQSALLQKLMVASYRTKTKASEYLIVMVYTGVFWSIFLFDMIGDVYGNISGGLATMVAPLLPISLWAFKIQIPLNKKRFASASSAASSGDNKILMNPQEVCDSFELKEIVSIKFG